MKILIDADGCPVVDLTLRSAGKKGVPVVILCDTSHRIEREGAQTLVFDKGVCGPVRPQAAFPGSLEDTILL